MSHTSVAVTLAGTPTHIPPEKWKNPNMEVDVKFDVYSSSIMLWELFADKKAYKTCSQGKIAYFLYRQICQFSVSDLKIDCNRMLM